MQLHASNNAATSNILPATAAAATTTATAATAAAATTATTAAAAAVHDKLLEHSQQVDCIQAPCVRKATHSRGARQTVRCALVKRLR
jgi:hypothetical protein